MKRVVHPFLFAVFPIAFLVQYNIRLIRIQQAGIVFFVTIGVVTLLYLAFTRAGADHRIVGVRISVVVLWFFLYGHVAAVLSSLFMSRGWDENSLLFPAWTIVWGALFVWAGRLRAREQVTRVLNIVAVALVAVNVGSLGLAYLQGKVAASEVGLGAPPRIADPKLDQRRDIYYLIFDRYAGADSLEEFLHYDNTPFLETLERRGFVMPARTRGNYPNTAMSLASSLNMSYLDPIGKKVGRAYGSMDPVHTVLHEHKLGLTMRSLGYRYVHIGSWWSATRQSGEANINYRIDPVSELTRAFYRTTVLVPFLGKDFAAGADVPALHRDVALAQFRTLAGAERLAGPKFVFAHILLPHPPYVFDRNGRAIDSQPVDVKGRQRAYVEQLMFTNRKIIEIVDSLQARPGLKPIIVIQSDEGPHPGFGRSTPANWVTATTNELKLKFGIFNAYYLPGIDPSAIYPTISPVNTFRLILDRYFGADLPLLGDRSYVSSKDHPYRFVSVTDRVR